MVLTMLLVCCYCFIIIFVFKQIEEFAMIPSKEAKLLLYRMFGEHFIHLTVKSLLLTSIP